MLFDLPIRRAFDTQKDIIDNPEHCSVDAASMQRYGLVVGQQLRIATAVGTALFTLSDVTNLSDMTGVRMGKAGRLRVSGGAEMVAKIDTVAVSQIVSDDTAQSMGNYVERLHDDGGSDLVFLAPHGGDIEHGTDEQARIAQLAASKSVAWIGKGWKPGGGAHAAWHITSTDLSPLSFPLLAAILPRRFKTAVSFHGHSGDTVIVGGRAPLSVLQRVRVAIADALSTANIAVVLSGTLNGGGLIGGTNPANLVNRITDGGVGGIQIEQSIKARTAYATPIAMAVTKVVMGL